MGLHARINHLGSEVNIALQGTIKKTEIAQIEAIILHFQNQGCRKIKFDLSQTNVSRATVKSFPQLSYILDRSACGSVPACD
jgi:hypothetical protein